MYWFNFTMTHLGLEPQTTIYKCLFQLEDSQSLHRKWLEITISIPFLIGCLFGVPGDSFIPSQRQKPHGKLLLPPFSICQGLSTGSQLRFWPGRIPCTQDAW